MPTMVRKCPQIKEIFKGDNVVAEAVGKLNPKTKSALFKGH